MKKNLNAIVARMSYPVTILLGISLHYFLVSRGFSVHLAAYLPAALGAVIITFLELKFPYREEWKADSSEVTNDVGFMVIVQMLLPKFLSFFIAITLLQFMQANRFTLEGFWPHAWPPSIQAILMLVIADFFRYWLHRASHEWLIALWQLHAVHHSPKKLYWVNVGRFHPIEKAMQYFFDALPFILLGVSEEVLALYFVFYAINGFFQHCNINLRLGPLNYLISGPELHRWHHSKKIRESNSNYGNNLIIWDLIFKTFYFPVDQKVGELGLINREYPQDFLSQMKTPFIKGIDKKSK